MQRTIPIGAVVLLSIVIGAVLVSYEQLKQCEFRLEKAFALAAPQRFERLGRMEQRAVKEWASLNHVSTSQALSGREARTFEINDRHCVVLLLERGAIGGSPAYCFDKAGALIGRYDDAE
jgi:hypothetical protein